MITLLTVVSLRMMLTAPATAKLNSDFSSLSLKYSQRTNIEIGKNIFTSIHRRYKYFALALKRMKATDNKFGPLIVFSRSSVLSLSGVI